jgi:hypothetical protein
MLVIQTFSMKRWPALLLAVIFLIALIIRLLPLTSYPYLIGTDSYYHARMAEQILTGNFYDPLSFGGRSYLYPPGMHILLASFSFMGTEAAAQLIPTLIAAFAVVAIFFVTRERYGEKAGFIAALLLAFVPVNIWKTASNSLVSGIDLTILLIAVYFLLRKEYKFYTIATIILAIFSPFVAIFALLLLLSDRKFLRSKIILTALAIAVLAMIIFFPLFGNIYITKVLPSDIKFALYENVTAEGLLFRLNPVLILGALGLLLQAARKKINRLLIFWTIFITGLSMLSLLETDRGLFYLAVPLAIYSAYIMTDKKIFKDKKIHMIILSAIIIFSAVVGIASVSSIYWSAMDPNERVALLWIEKNTPTDATVLATISEGHWVTGVAQRKNVIDGNMNGAPNFSERYEDVKTIYTTSDTEVRTELLNKYNVSYVLFSGWPYNLGGEDRNFQNYDIVFTAGIVKVFSVK